jgi:hypothetical protein
MVVAASGTLHSLYCLLILANIARKSAGGLNHGLVRLLFIQLIDPMQLFGNSLINAGILVMRGSYLTLWWDLVFGNFANARALFQYVDLVMSRDSTCKQEREVSRSHVQKD